MANKRKQENAPQISHILHPRTYVALYINDCVWVKDPVDIKDLQTRGSYGKGIFSRSVPNSDFLADMQEHLQLAHVEAFFLLDAINCLTIFDVERMELKAEACWKEFSKVNPRFPILYASYLYFRARGWVPKSGLKFGADFALYELGPRFTHATYSVIVKQLELKFPNTSGIHSNISCLAKLDEYSHRYHSWTALHGLQRLMHNVSKEILFCYVAIPSCSAVLSSQISSYLVSSSSSSSPSVTLDPALSVSCEPSINNSSTSDLVPHHRTLLANTRFYFWNLRRWIPEQSRQTELTKP